MGTYHWWFLLGWLILFAFLVYETWWFLASTTDEFFAYNYRNYSLIKSVGLPIGEIVGERPAAKSDKAKGEKKPSLARFYDETAKKGLLVYQPEVTIGRDPQNDIVIDDPTVSARHAALTYRHGVFHLQDVGSANGTYVSGKKITKAVLAHNATVRFGQATYKFQLPKGKVQAQPAHPESKREPVAWLVGEGQIAYPLRLGKNTIGRQDDNSVVLDDTTISRHHAVLYMERNAVTLQDLGSSNGTYVNGARLGSGRVRVELGAQVRFGSQELLLREERGSQKSVAGPTVDGVRVDPSVHAGEVVSEQRMQAFLISSDGHRTQVDKKETRIGRSPANDVVIDDSAVSAHHASITIESQQFILRDLDSSNGTIVNGTKTKEHVLQQGDIIQFGQSRFVFQIR